MARRNGHPDDCGCCAGTDAKTPRRISNLPGKPSISYRIGDYARFRESLLSGLSDSRFPALSSLGTREGTDFTIALCDALATSLDVLTFYQERIANEHYLRTATESRSVQSMARLIGYTPAPGVAASTYLAFTLQDTPGDRSLGVEPVEIPRGTAVQSVPGPGQKAQTFETVEPAMARLEWNAVPAQVTEHWQPEMGDTEVVLDGVGTQLQPGDAILILGQERLESPGDEHWDVRVLTSVETDTKNERTRVTWAEGLGAVSPFTPPAARGVRVFALRQRAALFGHNAPDPNLMNTGEGSNLDILLVKSGGTLVTPWQWDSFSLDSSEDSLDLDASYPTIVAGSWVVLVSNEEGLGSSSLPGYVELYKADSVRQVSRSDFGLSSRVTRVGLDTVENLDRFGRRKTLVLAGSEELTPLPRVLAYPAYGDRLALETRVEGLTPDQPLAILGRRQRITVGSGVTGLELLADEGGTVVLQEGDSLVLVSAAERLQGTTPVALDPQAFEEAIRKTRQRLRLRVMDRDGRTGRVHCRAHQIHLEPSREGDPAVAEIAVIASGADSVLTTRDTTILKLSSSLKNAYDRSSVRVNANVAPATHGETVEEILGSGDAGGRDQAFPLRQSPLTYVSAATPSGRGSTVALRVNDLLWTEVDSLYGAGAGDRVFSIRTDPEGRATVVFGDGTEGARIPTGQNNVRAVYRKNLGVDGNVSAGKITNLLSRPQGVKGATNPEPAEGGADREALDESRENAPLSVLTLDRAVSVQDYADFARGFAGIAKAVAVWVPVGPARGIFLTVAGIDGAPINEAGATRKDLLSALRTFGDPLIPLQVVDYRPGTFRTGLAVQVARGYEPEKTLDAVEKSLREAFGFRHRTFGQGVTEGEVMAVAHGVRGVDAVRVTRLYRPGPGVTPSLQARLSADLPVASLTTLPEAAEVLTLDPAHLELEVMT